MTHLDLKAAREVISAKLFHKEVNCHIWHRRIYWTHQRGLFGSILIRDKSLITSDIKSLREMMEDIDPNKKLIAA